MLKFFQQTDLECVPSSEQNIMISGSQLLNRVLLLKILFNITTTNNNNRTGRNRTGTNRNKPMQKKKKESFKISSGVPYKQRAEKWSLP